MSKKTIKMQANTDKQKTRLDLQRCADELLGDVPMFGESENIS